MILTLCILSIIASWIYHLPQEWAITITIFASLVIVEDIFIITDKN